MTARRRCPGPRFGQPTRAASQKVADRISTPVLRYDPWKCPTCRQWHITAALQTRRST